MGALSNMHDENKRLHLQMIENIISRMSSNSFLIKGWSVTVIGGLMTLYFTKIRHHWSYNLLWIALGICFIFWVCDAYYLDLERRYRNLYDIVRHKDETDIDFDMRPPASHENLVCCMFRPVFCCSYFLIFIALLFIMCTKAHVF